MDVALARVMRESYGKLLALLTAGTRDLSLAEDALAEALAIASDRWASGEMPLNPEGWLLTVARRRAIDGRRHGQAAQAWGLEPPALNDAEPAVEAEPELVIPDRRLELMLLCAHPAIEESVRAPLMLQVVLGLDSTRIAQAFLVAPAAMAQRLVRAKAKIGLTGIRFARPTPDEIPGRLRPVLDAIYTAYVRDWSELRDVEPGADTLSAEAIWLGALLVKLVPDEPEALGLLSLMLHLEARRGARRSAAGAFVPLDEQDLARWDHELIDEANMLLGRAAEHRTAGRYQLEAAIQSAHAHRRTRGEPDWVVIDQLYAQLHIVTGSPVVGINRAMVVAKLSGAAAGLTALDDAGRDTRCVNYQPYWAARAELLARSGDLQGARAAYDRAILLAPDEITRTHLAGRRP